MRYLEHRRHTMRVKPGQNLSQEGVSLARRIGQGIGPFAYVLTSTIPRAFQTAIAMGFAVTAEDEMLSTYGEDVEAEISWPASFSEYAAAVARNGAAARYAHKLAGLMHETAWRLTDGQSALIISHGGVVELSAIGVQPDLDYSLLGEGIDYCEGVRLTFDGERFIRAEVLRVPRDGWV